ncbi:LLM class flavin-dependent oxidoreductase [Gordonia sp. DT30]|uniref:LLM class flavin-dependent oxidoreductase n=1 Tax=Gordonia sp. DT30 TaxID=3416546 RepID=UPI003CF8D389
MSDADTSAESPPGHRPLVIVGLDRAVAAALLAPGRADERADWGRRLDDFADAILVGADLVLPGHSGPWGEKRTERGGIDPSLAAIVLAAVTSRAGLLVAASPLRDHPYNLARRIAGLDHASRGRAGLAIAPTDPRAPTGSPWTSAVPDAAAADAVIAVRELWRSFPADAVIADPARGVFAESERIVAIDHRGAFDIDGPLQLPSGPQVWPPVVTFGEPSPDLARVADLVVTESDREVVVHHPRDVDELADLLTGTASTSVDQDVLRDGAVSGALPTPTLRDLLGLAAVRLPTGGRILFPAAETDTRQPVGANSHVR